MLKKILVTYFCAVCWMAVSAQTSLDTLKARYEANKRDMVAVKEYATALGEAKQVKEAESVVREYMSRCPVLQFEDRDTYLLINRYVFDDPYSEVFGHAIYAWNKMKWKRDEKKITNGREVMLMSLFKGLSKGVSGGDEIDKRYEVLSMLSSNLHKEIDRQCSPRYEKTKYVMPEIDIEKMNCLEHQLNRGELLRQMDMRLKIDLARAWNQKDWDYLLNKLVAAIDFGIESVGGSYAIGMLTCLAEESLTQGQVKQGLAFALRLCQHEEKFHGSINFYNLVGKWYELAGDRENAEKYTKIGDGIEAERMKKFGHLLKLFQDKE